MQKTITTVVSIYISTMLGVMRRFFVLRCSHITTYAALRCSKISAFHLSLANCKQTLSSLFLFSLSLLFLTGCGVIHPYQPDVQQGNVVSQTMAENVHPGMSKEQVRSMLGSSVLPNLFDENHWAYVYTMQRNGGQIVRKKMDIFFQNDRVVRVSKAEGKIS